VGIIRHRGGKAYQYVESWVGQCIYPGGRAPQEVTPVVLEEKGYNQVMAWRDVFYFTFGTK